MSGEEAVASRFDLRGTLQGAATAALLMLWLSFPILAYRAEADFSNQLVLKSRWFAVFIAVAAAFILRFTGLVFPRRAAPRPPPRRENTRRKSLRPCRD